MMILEKLQKYSPNPFWWCDHCFHCPQTFPFLFLVDRGKGQGQGTGGGGGSWLCSGSRRAAARRRGRRAGAPHHPQCARASPEQRREAAACLGILPPQGKGWTTLRFPEEGKKTKSDFMANLIEKIVLKKNWVYSIRTIFLIKKLPVNCWVGNPWIMTIAAKPLNFLSWFLLPCPETLSERIPTPN